MRLDHLLSKETLASEELAVVLGQLEAADVTLFNLEGTRLKKRYEGI